MKWFIRIALPGVLLFVLSCKKVDVPNYGKRLERIFVHSVFPTDSTITTMFKYDNKDRLIAIIDSFNPGAKRITELFYNTEGRLTSATKNYAPRIDSFVYNTNGVLTDVYSTSWGSYVSHKILVYDQLGRLVRDSTYNPSPYFTWVTTFVYNNNNDIVQWEQSSYQDGVIKWGSAFHAEYAGNENPYKSMGIAYYLLRDKLNGMGAYDNSVVLSAHERVSQGYEQYQYIYLPNGLVDRIVAYYNAPGNSLTYFIDFSYE